MTPAPISVERLRVHTADHGDDRKPYGMMMPDARGEYVRHSDYAALLQQLAEARILIEDAGSALRVMIATAKAARWPITAGQMVPLNMARQEVRRIAAFLAASGGAAQ